MNFLFDCTDGYFIFDENKIEMAKYEFSTVDEAVDSISKLNTDRLPENLKNFLEEHNLTEFAVADDRINRLLQQYKTVVDHEFYRSINLTGQKLLSNIAHRLAKQNISFDERRNDVGIVQGIKTYDDFERDINIHIMRIREWYGFHFPELNFICDNLKYLRVVEIVQMKDKFTEYEKLESIISAEEIEKIKHLQTVSMGADINREDMDKIIEDIQSILKINTYRVELKEYIKNRVEEVAPNLYNILGEIFTARYIARAGGLTKLAKMPASTIQILGAEKALFSALKKKINTPKYGLIFSHPLLGMSKRKGGFTRTLCAKIALSARVDAYSEDRSGTFGKKAYEDLYRKHIQ